MYMERKNKGPFVLMMLILVGVGSYYAYKIHKELQQTQIEQFNIKEMLQALPRKTQTSSTTVQEEVLTPSPSWIDIQKKVKDTVVQIFCNLTEFNWLEPYKTPRQGEGTGSGFFINESGDIVTNYHVVEQASTIQFQIPSFGMERFDANIIGASPERDIALLKVTKESLEKIKAKLGTIPYLALGDSDQIVRSQEVLALGYPLGQTRLKSTLGIVSGRERLGYFGYIQVTTPLNRGNSGGPALNTTGEVIGINSRGVLEAQNVGYIIPINEVKSALKDLYRIRLLRKPTLGCIFTVTTPELVSYLGNPAEGGWYIAKVFDNTLLKSVGVQSEDMLYEVNGNKIDMYGELNVPWSEDKVSLFELLNRYTIGDTLNFLIYRKGKPLTFSFKLIHKYLPPIRTVYTEFEPEATDYEVLGGMILMNLTLNHVGILLPQAPELVRFGRPENQHKGALIITHVLPNSQAYKARVLRPGEIIEEINGEKVESLDDFRKVVKKQNKAQHLTIRTSDNLYAVLSVEKIKKDEEILPARYFYKPSKLLSSL